jgi:copper transport protein
MSRLRRTAARVGVCLVAGTATVVMLPGTALAHAELDRTNPPTNAVLPDAPKVVDLQFSEPVEVAFGSIRVLDAAGRRADIGDPFHPGGRGSVVDVQLRSGLQDGTYLVSWRVVSDDSHPVSGDFTFSIGAPGVAPQASGSGGGSVAVGLLLGAARFAGFAGLALLLGTSIFLLLCWPAGWRDRRARRLLAVGWGTSTGATVIALLLQGPYGAGSGLTSLVHGSVLQSTLTTRFGHAHVVRLWLLLAFAGVVVAQVHRASVRDRRSAAGATRAGSIAAVAIGIALLATVAVAGHADDGTDRVLSLPIDVLHLTAMAAWVGGLATVVYCLLLKPAPPGELRTVMPRFSSLAADAVLLLVATGTFAAWRDLGSWGALTGTRQGLLLILKLSVLAALLLAAAASRRWLRSRREDSPDGGWSDVRALRVSVGAEAALATALLAVTAVLVAAPPGKTEWHRPSTSQVSQQGSPSHGQVTEGGTGRDARPVPPSGVISTGRR